MRDTRTVLCKVLALVTLAILNEQYKFQSPLLHNVVIYDGVSKSFRTESITKYTLTCGITRWEATKKRYGDKTH